MLGWSYSGQSCTSTPESTIGDCAVAELEIDIKATPSNTTAINQRGILHASHG